MNPLLIAMLAASLVVWVLVLAGWALAEKERSRRRQQPEHLRMVLGWRYLLLIIPAAITAASGPLILFALGLMELDARQIELPDALLIVLALLMLLGLFAALFLTYLYLPWAVAPYMLHLDPEGLYVRLRPTGRKLFAIRWDGGDYELERYFYTTAYLSRSRASRPDGILFPLLYQRMDVFEFQRPDVVLRLVLQRDGEIGGREMNVGARKVPLFTPRRFVYYGGDRKAFREYIEKKRSQIGSIKGKVW